MKNLRLKLILSISISIFILLAIMIASCFVGLIDIKISDLIFPITSDELNKRDIFLSIRLSRVILSVLTGACLSAVGAIFQAILRNPLADPYTLGIAGGASLGATIAMMLPLPSYLLINIDYLSIGLLSTLTPGITFILTSWISLLAFLGSLLTLLFVFFLLGKKSSLSGNSLILAGITTNFLFSGLVMLLYYFASPFDTSRMIRWIMGSIEPISYSQILLLSIFLLPIFVYFIYSSRTLNLVGIGNDFAQNRGILVTKIYKKMVIFSSVIVALVVSITGPIGFVGLIVPHILRKIVGYDHRFLLVLSILWGAIFLTICDLFSRNILYMFNYTVELPIGIMTALIGSIFFLGLLKTGNKNN